tara:strand:+ start:2691 stop:4010 length:1320 start_codon:yes stop_codon:yes gene_type:complete
MATQVNLSRSPYYVKIIPDTVGTVESSTTQIWIYTGTQTPLPAQPTYTLVKKPIGTSDLIVLELAQLVNDYVTTSYDGTYSTDTFFLYWSTVFVDSAGTQIGSSVTASDYFPFSKGYGFFNEGINPYMSSDTVITNPNTNQIPSGYASDNYFINVPQSEPIQIPSVVTILDSIEINYYTGSYEEALAGQKVMKTETLSNANGDSDKFIQYSTNENPTAYIPQSETQWDNLVAGWNAEIENNTDSPTRSVFWCPYNENPTTWISVAKVGQSSSSTKWIKVNYLRKDKFEPYKVTFINRYGALENFWMMGSKKEVLSVTGDTFMRNLINIPTTQLPSDTVNYNPDAHQFVTFGEQGKTEIKLTTGWIEEENNDVLKQLFLSQKIWLTNYQTNEQRENSEPFIIEPVILKSKNLNYKTHLQEKVINYEVNFQFAYEEINQVY